MIRRSLGFLILGAVLTVGCSKTVGLPAAPLVVSPSVTASATPVATKTALPSSTATPLTATFTATLSSTATLTPTAIPTVTVSAPVSIVPSVTPVSSQTGILFIGQIYETQCTSPGHDDMLSLDLSVNGSAESTDQVTLVAPQGNFNVPFVISGGSVAQYDLNATGGAGQWVYIPGQTYSLIASTSIGAVTATLAAPGGFTIAANGSQVSINYPGNDNGVTISSVPAGAGAMTPVYENNNAVSPQLIPASTYSSPGQYYFYVDVFNSLASMTGTNPNSTFRIGQQGGIYIQK